jgi:hypothetical protein
LFDAGRDAHPNVWLLVAAGQRGSFPPAFHLFLRAQESVWRRWEGRPRPDLRDPEFGADRPVMLRRRETPAASPPPGGRPPRREETARLFGHAADMKAFVEAARWAGAVLDPGAECPPVSPLLAGTAPNSAPHARWIGRVYTTLMQHRPTLIQRTPPTPDGIELYVLDLDPWEASLLTIRLLTGQAAAAPGGGGAEPAAAEAVPPAPLSPNEVGVGAIHPMSGDRIPDALLSPGPPVRIDAAAGGPTPLPARPASAPVRHHGGRSYSLDGGTPVAVSAEQDNALKAFLDRGEALTTRQLEGRGVTNVAKVMGKLRQRFGEAVRLPSRKGDGYYVHVRPLE